MTPEENEALGHDLKELVYQLTELSRTYQELLRAPPKDAASIPMPTVQSEVPEWCKRAAAAWLGPRPKRVDLDGLAGTIWEFAKPHLAKPISEEDVQKVARAIAKEFGFENDEAFPMRYWLRITRVALAAIGGEK